MGGVLFMVERDYNFGESIVYGIGSGFGMGISDFCTCRGFVKSLNIQMYLHRFVVLASPLLPLGLCPWALCHLAVCRYK